MIFERSQKALCEKMKGDTEMKRVLSLVLSALLIVSMLMTGAMAETMEVEQTLHLVRFASNNYNTYDFIYPWTDLNDSSLETNLLWLTLIQADKNLEASEPEIMESWEVSEDGCTITMTMRDDLQWSDGTPITMDDIIWTFEQYCAGESNFWSYVTSAMAYIEGYDAFHNGEADSISGLAVDGNVLTITLVKPYASFLNLMCQVAPLPKHIYENCSFANNSFKTDPIWQSVKVNSGPFIVTEHVPGSYYVLEPNPYYKGEPSKITKVISTVVSSKAVAAQNGEVDFFETTSIDDYNVMSQLADYHMEAVPIIFFRFLMFNFYDSEGNPKDFVSDVRVRQAIAKGVDWKTIIEGLFGEQASLTQTGVLSNDPNYAGDWYEYDPEGAKALLDEAGFDYNHTLKAFYYYTDQTTIDIMDAISYYLGMLGVKVEAVYTANTAADVFEGRTHDFAYYGLSAFDNLSWYQMYLRPNFDELLGSIDVFEDAVSELEVAFTDELMAEALAKLQAMDEENIFFLPVYTINQQAWIKNTLSIPEDSLGNGWFFYDHNFEEWEIIA